VPNRRQPVGVFRGMRRFEGPLAFCLAALGSGLIAASGAGARTFHTVERECPFTGTKFRAHVDASGTRICLRLDLKPIGYIGAPPELPVCPDDGFVVFKDAFSKGEVERLRPWVESQEFRRLASEESTYYRKAATLRRLGAPSSEVAWALVQASWQVEDDADKYGRYVSEALAELTRAAAESPPTAGGERASLEPDAAALLAGELARRTGQGQRARERFQQLKQKPGLDQRLLEMVDRELELVNAGDFDAHYVPREREAACARSD